jgi:hypothetical protein
MEAQLRGFSKLISLAHVIRKSKNFSLSNVDDFPEEVVLLFLVNVD